MLSVHRQAEAGVKGLGPEDPTIRSSFLDQVSFRTACLRRLTTEGSPRLEKAVGTQVSNLCHFFHECNRN